MQLDNYKIKLFEERLLLNPVYREKIARGIVEGIIVYHRIMMRR